MSNKSKSTIRNRIKEELAFASSTKKIAYMHNLINIDHEIKISSSLVSLPVFFFLSLAPSLY